MGSSLGSWDRGLTMVEGRGRALVVRGVEITYSRIMCTRAVIGLFEWDHRVVGHFNWLTILHYHYHLPNKPDTRWLIGSIPQYLTPPDMCPSPLDDVQPMHPDPESARIPTTYIANIAGKLDETIGNAPPQPRGQDFPRIPRHALLHSHVCGTLIAEPGISLDSDVKYEVCLPIVGPYIFDGPVEVLGPGCCAY